MSASSGLVRAKKPSSLLQKPSENPRLPQKRGGVQRTSARRVLGDLSNINRAPKSVQKPKSDASCVKRKTTKVEQDEFDEIETCPPEEHDEDKWVEPQYFKALTTILCGNLVKPSDELSAVSIPEPEMEKSRRLPYSLPPGLFPTSCSPVIDICDISPFDVDEDFRKYVD